MLDMDTEVYELIKLITTPAITWSPGFPQSFAGLTGSNGIGAWKVKSNGNAEKTSTRKEWISSVDVEIQTWAATPELRLAYDLAIDLVFGGYFTRSPAGGHLEEKLTAEITAYRSILMYQAKIRDDYQIM